METARCIRIDNGDFHPLIPPADKHWRHWLSILCIPCVGISEASAQEAIPPRTEPLVVLRADGSIGAELIENRLFVRASYKVQPNVLGIARRPQSVSVPSIRGRATQSFSQARFEPREGFSVDDDGNIIVDSDPANVSYFWYGKNGRDHLFLTVSRGLVNGMVYGPGLRFGLSSAGGTAVLRDTDAAAVDAGGCATEAARVAATDPDASKRFAALTLRSPAAPGANTEAAAAASVSFEQTVAALPKHSARITLLVYYTGAALDLFRTADPNFNPLPLYRVGRRL